MKKVTPTETDLKRLFVSGGDGTVWPALTGGDIEWTLRYGTAEEMVRDRYAAAQIVAAYYALIRKNQKERNRICELIKKAVKDMERKPKRPRKESR